MDRTKLRLLFAGAAALFGLAGAISLAAALSVALAPSLGQVWAIVASAALMLGVAGAFLFFALQPDEPIEEDIAAAEETAAMALSELPFDTLKAIVEKQPLAALSAAMMAGYALRRDPGATAQGVRRLLATFL